MLGAYAKAGVDYTQMEPFKMAMIEAGRKTLTFPNRRGVYVNEDALHAHGAVFEYRGEESHIWVKTQEDLGNKNWIAEWMYERTGVSHYDSIAIDTALIVVNDVIAQGAMPVIFTDQLEASESSWYADEKRAQDLARGFYEVCKEVGMALPAGESASVKYIVNPTPPVKAIAALSGSVTGIVAPKEKLITGALLTSGDHIIAVASSGLHANGVSLVIQKALELPDQFLTKLPSGTTIGEASLTPMRSYVQLIEALQNKNVTMHALLPGTGDGIGKLAFDKRPFTYRIRSWLTVPELFRYFKENLGIPMIDCMKTFNWGAGYYLFVPEESVDVTLSTGRENGYELMDVGIVEAGKREIIFEPEGITLNPPGA